MPLDSALARALWQRARTVCFDVDSTVSPDEGIDVLAAHAGVADEVAALTRAAMGGAQRFEDSIAARLGLIRPTEAMIAACLGVHPPRLTEGAASLVAALHRRGVAVHLVSGGFEPFVAPLAAALGVPLERVHTNRFVFGESGVSTDPLRPTSRSGGKPVVMEQLLAAGAGRPLVMVGDGMTDLEARPPADLAVGFGGVVVRERVRAEADWFVTSFAALEAALDG
ncbi:MAG: HAD family hydrolase [Myxococcales bacterium]|nr:MAG: HAD family hydrolase [Myxococcales bacterium]